MIRIGRLLICISRLLLFYLRLSDPLPPPSNMLDPLSLGIFVKVQLYLVSASRALDVLLQPSPQAVQMKDVSAFKFLGLLDFLQTDDTGIVHAYYLLCRYIGQFFEFVNQLPRLDEKLNTLAEPNHCIYDFSKEVKRE